MSDIHAAAEVSLAILKKKGASKAQVEVGLRETHELNVEAGRLTLLRTNFDQGVSLRALEGSKQASLSGNQLSGESIEELASQTVEAARASSPDEAFDVAPPQPREHFRAGLREGDLDRLTERLEEFVDTVRLRYPKIILEQAILQFVKRHRVVTNTNGVYFEIEQGDYGFSCMFTAKDGSKTSSFNSFGASLANLDEPLIQLADGETLLRQSSEQTDVRQLSGKFIGDVIVTPHCLPNFIGALTGYLGIGSLLKGSSVYQDKLGEQIADERFSLSARPLDPRFSRQGFITNDGFASENVEVIRNGRLETFLLGQYGANKLRQNRAKADDGNYVVEAGVETLESMISKVKRGLLLCRFSGGDSASNGDVSGVAKNSYYIENGQIQYPVSEVMVSANIPRMFKNVEGLSRERLNFGTSLLPWMTFRDVTISGK